MAKNTNPQQYDEDDATRYIRNFLPQELKEKLSDDDINYIIDIVYDYYDDKGLLDENIQEDVIVDIDEEELLQYVIKNTKKDKVKAFSADEITFIIQGELSYCESIGIFE